MQFKLDSAARAHRRTFHIKQFFPNENSNVHRSIDLITSQSVRSENLNEDFFFE